MRLKQIVKFTIVGFFIVILASFFTKYVLTNRLQVIVTFAILLPCMVIERMISDKLWTHFIVEKFFKKNVVIYGADDTGKRLAK